MKGVKYLQEQGLLDEAPSAVAQFVMNDDRLDKVYLNPVNFHLHGGVFLVLKWYLKHVVMMIHHRCLLKLTVNIVYLVYLYKLALH